MGKTKILSNGFGPDVEKTEVDILPESRNSCARGIHNLLGQGAVSDQYTRQRDRQQNLQRMEKVLQIQVPVMR